MYGTHGLVLGTRLPLATCVLFGGKSYCRPSFDQNFRKFRYKIKWNRNFPETRFENSGQPLEVVLFFGNLEIPEIFCTIWRFCSVRLGPSSPSRGCCLDKVYKMAELPNLYHCSVCFFTSDDFELFLRPVCVDSSGNIAPPVASIGKSKTKLNGLTPA